MAALRTLFFFQLSLLLLPITVSSQARPAHQDGGQKISFTVSMSRPQTHSPADFQKTCELMAGSNLEQFFARYVRGREELDYAAAFIAAGLRLDRTGPIDVAGSTKHRGWLGAELNQQDERLIVSRVLAGSPAYEQGLNANDQIVALDGVRVNKEMFETMLTARRPGDVIRLTIFRFDDLRTLEIRLGDHMEVLFRILTLSQLTDEQRQNLSAVDGRTSA